MRRRTALFGLLAAPLAACDPRQPPATPPVTPPSVRGREGPRIASGPPAATTTGSLRVFCLGAHPDDPEFGCGGTLARYASLGHAVTIAYLTRGEGGVANMPFEESGRVREAEARRACEILGAKPMFLPFKGGEVRIDNKALDAFAELVDGIDPDVLFGHWPFDDNYEHQLASTLIVRAYMQKKRKSPLYFFEVETGTQTVGFAPTVYVDIAKIVEKKLLATRAHQSQNPDRIYERFHEPLERFRGRESAAALAEGFAALQPNATTLPGL